MRSPGWVHGLGTTHLGPETGCLQDAICNTSGELRITLLSDPSIHTGVSHDGRCTQVPSAVSGMTLHHSRVRVLPTSAVCLRRTWFLKTCSLRKLQHLACSPRLCGNSVGSRI